MEPDVIETVLTELLEEQRQANSKLASFTAVLMELHEEKTSLKADTTEKLGERLRAVQMSLQSLPSQIQIPLKEITQLNQSLDQCTAQLQQPIQQVVKHHIAKIWMVAAGLLITVVIMIYFLLDSRSQLKQYEAGEIKYRYLKLVSNSNLQWLLFYTDSLYRLKPDSFKVAVLQKEAEEQRRLKLLQKAKSKEKEAEQLRQRASQVKRQK
jgi:hypothetical protein